MINLKCPQCSTEGIVKRWETSFVDGNKRPWCFCPRCWYKYHGSFTEASKVSVEDTAEWIMNTDVKKVAEYIVNLENTHDK